MTAKDKAIELLNEFNNHIIFSFNVKKELSVEDLTKLNTIKTINEIIKELDSERVFERLNFWNEVKEEIEKL